MILSRVNRRRQIALEKVKNHRCEPVRALKDAWRSLKPTSRSNFLTNLDPRLLLRLPFLPRHQLKNVRKTPAIAPSSIGWTMVCALQQKRRETATLAKSLRFGPTTTWMSYKLVMGKTQLLTKVGISKIRVARNKNQPVDPDSIAGVLLTEEILAVEKMRISIKSIKTPLISKRLTEASAERSPTPEVLVNLNLLTTIKTMDRSCLNSSKILLELI